MFATEWLALPISRLITLTLLHFVWQGFAVAALLLVMVEACRVRRVGARYVCSLVALVMMVLAPVATLGVLIVWPGGGSELVLGGLDLASTSPPAVISFWGYWVQRVEPAVLAVWCCGVVLFGGRLLTGAVGVARLRRNALPLPTKFVAVVEQLGRRLRIDAVGLVLLSHQVADAMAVGLVRPLVLIPAAWVTEMPVEMLEAVIAHELAHLARRDLWVNLLQRIVETVLFYHPAVWWLSRRLRIERELCADELAVMATGKRLEYAQALEQIAGERLADIRPALAAFLRGENEMRLLQRVRNVLKQSPEERSRLWPAGLAALALPLGLWAAAAWNNAAVADDEEKKPVIKRDRAERTEAKRATVRADRERSEKNKQIEGDKERLLGIVNDVILDKKKSVPAEVREERYTIVRDGQPVEERVERVVVARDGKPLTVDKDRSRYASEDSNRDGKKPAVPEVREERYTIVRDGKSEQIVDKVIVMKDGKPVTVAVPREHREAANDHRLDELTTLVKQLSQNVERLQNEVSRLRAEKQGGEFKGSQFNRGGREDEERSSLERTKRSLQQDMEKVETAKRDVEARAKAIKQEAEEKAQAAMRAAGEKAEAKERAAKQQAEAAQKAAMEQKERAVRDREEEKDKRRVEEERSPKNLGLKERRVEEPRAGEGGELSKKIIDARELRESERSGRERTLSEIKKLEERLKKLKEGQRTSLPELDEDHFTEVKMQRLERDQQALLTGPGPQPKPVARPGVGR